MVVHEPLKLPGRKTRSKNFETPFFQDIQNSFHGIADIGLEPHQKFFFEKISKIKATSRILSFLLFWREIHFYCNYILSIFREVEFHIDLQLVKFWW